MENAEIFDTKANSMTGWHQRLSKTVFCFAPKHLLACEKNQSSGVQFHNGLPLYLNSAKKSWTRWKVRSSTLSEWGKCVFTTLTSDQAWLIISSTMLGGSTSYLLCEDGTPNHDSWNDWARGSTLWEHDSSGWDVMQRISCQKDLHASRFTKWRVQKADIMDVWFDSGSSWNGVVVNRPELTYSSRSLPCCSD